MLPDVPTLELAPAEPAPELEALSFMGLRLERRASEALAILRLPCKASRREGKLPERPSLPPLEKTLLKLSRRV